MAKLTLAHGPMPPAGRSTMTNLERLQGICRNKQAGTLKWPANRQVHAPARALPVDMTTANAVLSIRDALSDAHKVEFDRRLESSYVSAVTLIEWCWKKVGGNAQ